MFSENLLDSRSKEVLELAKNIAQQRNDKLVDTDHLLLALLQTKDSPLVKVLEKRGIDTKDLQQKVNEYLNDVYGQLDKAVREYIEYLRTLQSQLSQVKSSVQQITSELKKIKKAERELENELRYEESFWGGFGSSARLELERLRRYEKELKSQLASIQSQLQQLTDQETVDAFLNGEISLSALLYKIIENSDLVKQLQEIGISPDRVVVKIAEEVLGTKSGKIYSNNFINFTKI